MLKEPESMDDLAYFTRRQLLGGKGFAMAWVERQPCPKCKKATMGKPAGKDGSVKIRAKEYVCPACKYTVEKEEYEDTLTCNVKYTCPHCKKQGEASVPFDRKKVTVIDEGEGGKKSSVDAIRFACSSCSKNIDIVKKMKK
ncbi:MAG: hypothetical protein AABX47_03160 [Nanoarchaeota archaeon]